MQDKVSLVSRRTILCAGLTTALSFLARAREVSPSMATCFLYVGSYTGPESRGIYGFRFNRASGSLTPLGLTAETPNPSFVLVEQGHGILYTVNETTGASGEIGAVRALRIDPRTGGLTSLNEASSFGVGPCFLSLDRTRKYLFVANFHSGSIAAIALLPDGRLGERTAFIQHYGSSKTVERQKSPHPHAICVAPGNNLVVVADLGLDKILLYHFDPANGAMYPSDPPFIAAERGAGPRHLAISQGGEVIYAINEINSSVTAYRRAKAGLSFQVSQTISTLPDGFSSEGDAAEIAIDSTGRFIYTSTRRSNTLRVFAIDRQTGKLSILFDVSSGGESPHTFAIDPSSRWLIVADQASNNLAVFRRSTPSQLAFGYKISAPSPSSIAFYLRD